jgi:protocatechuate 3,4-dioxygenase beta subunit
MSGRAVNRNGKAGSQPTHNSAAYRGGMEHDHEGQRVSRRTLFAGISSLGLGGLLAACTGSSVETSTGETVSPQATTSPKASDTDLFADATTCELTEETTQGPYYFDADKVRSDIREDREGTRLDVAIKVQDSETCRALPNAVVEIWHCDAAGLYSGAEAMSSGSGGPGQGGQAGGDLEPQDDKRYLRGAQVTNADGIVRFTTIWPGWYRGRTVHIHAMVHFSNERVLTTQVMFDEKLNSTVFAAEPYSKRTGRDTFNDGDSIYDDSMLLKIVEQDEGYLGAIVFAADSDQDNA